jgi:hypothetical protein
VAEDDGSGVGVGQVRGSRAVARRHAVPVALALVLVGALATSSSAPATAEGTGLSVDGNVLTLDGAPFLPQGFNSVGVLAPDWCTKGQGIPARAHFDQTEMDAAKAWNANMLRLQVSQRGIADPAIDQAQRDTYLQRVVDAVALARSNGLVVDLSMQDQSNGCGKLRPLPSAETVSAWTVLAARFADDPYVMFELYNEPDQENTAAGWNQWQNGGVSPNANLGETAVGHQFLVDTIRGLGATNVLVADGLNKAGRLSGLPLLSDPLDRLAYAVHPYWFTKGETWWQSQYGYLTPTKPVIATEWAYFAESCGTAKETRAPALLAYLRDHGIGVLAHAIDVPGSTIADWSWRPTQCGTAVGGSGQLTKDHFTPPPDPPIDPPVDPPVDPPPDGGTDTTPPTAPTALEATVVSDTSVTLSWGAATDDSGGVSYLVLRDGAVVGPASQELYTDVGLSPTTTYAYAVVAVDAAGNRSEASTPVTVTTLQPRDTSAPTAPRALTARLLSPTSSSLSWTGSTDDVGVVGYRIVRNGAVIATTDADPRFTDTRMPAGTTSTYTVNALDAAGNISVSSNQVQVVAPAPAASGLSATYFASTTLSNPRLSRIDPQVSFAWGTAAPATGVPADRFSVRWTGKVIPVANGTVTFYAQSDNGMRVWVNGTRIINDWTAHALRERSASLSLSANRAYTVKVEYYENTSAATAKLLWSSTTLSKQPIPQSQLLAQ